MLTPRDTPAIRDEIIRQVPGFGWLRRAPLYWATHDMSELAHAQHESMPAWTPSECEPSPQGMLVMWEEQSALEALQRVYPDVSELCVVFVWRGLDSGKIEISSFSYSPGVEVAELFTIAIPAGQTLPLEEGELLPTPERQQLREATTQRSLDYRTSMGHEACSLLGCAWILMQLPTVAEGQQIRVKKPRKKNAKNKQVKFDKVQCVSLRKSSPHTTTVAEQQQAGSGRKIHVRFFVKGHWRQQRVGPGRKLRRPTFVAPHIKGPEGAPLKTERVQVWDR